MIDQNLGDSTILLVDDEETSIKLLESILQKEGFLNIHSCTDSRAAIDMYNKLKPDCLILDLNMPHVDGFEIIDRLNKDKGDEEYLPIIILSSQEDQASKVTAMELGAQDFINKPCDRMETLVRIKNMLNVRMLHSLTKNQNVVLEEKVKERTKDLYEAQIDVIQRLARAIEYRDFETGMHTLRMSHYSELLAKKSGMNEEECDLVLNASPLHDIGKIGIPDSILCKPEKLTAEEYEIMKTHTTIGAELLSGSKSKYLVIAKEIAISHHEKWNGEGYPNGLKGEDIPLVGRICGLCDVFDALMSKRPYKKAWSFEETIAEIKRSRGSHFDPTLVDHFLEILPQINEIRNKYTDSSQ